jgi:hypothetical protein
MNERLSFFCDRSAAHCHLYAWTEADAGSETLVQVWCRTALDETGPAAQGAGSHGNLRHQVAHGGGGLIARTRHTGDLIELHCEAVAADGYQPPSELLLLRPGREPESLPFADHAVTLDTGAYVLLPASRADQSLLGGLLEHLHRLPGDYRDLLLNVLRRPGLEAAMARLQQRLDRPDLGAAPRAAGGPPGGIPGAGLGHRWPWVLAGLLVLNLLGIAGLWFKSAGPAAGGRLDSRFEVPLDLKPWPGLASPPTAPATTALPAHARATDLEGGSPRPAEHPKNAPANDARPTPGETGK